MQILSARRITPSSSLAQETTMVRFRRVLILAGLGIGVAIAAVVTLDKFVLLIGVCVLLFAWYQYDR